MMILAENLHDHDCERIFMISILGISMTIMTVRIFMIMILRISMTIMTARGSL